MKTVVVKAIVNIRDQENDIERQIAKALANATLSVERVRVEEFEDIAQID